MTTTTQCPECDTRFKVTQEQLEAHNGLVRCGRCQAVFDARQALQDDQPSPQLDLLAAQAAQAATGNLAEHHAGTPSGPGVAVPLEMPVAPGAAVTEKIPGTPFPAEGEEDEPSLAEQARYEWHDPDAPAAEKPVPTLAQRVNVDPPPAVLAAKKSPVWPWAAGSLLLLLVVLAQSAYFFRVEIAASQPGLKPALLSYCGLLGCDVPLPHKVELMSIESSDIEADPARPSVIILNALLRNHAAHAQAYPQLELTLTDAQEKPLARRAFVPAEYLRGGENEALGLEAGRELAIRLNLDTADLAPSGYRLFLFYPQ